MVQRYRPAGRDDRMDMRPDMISDPSGKWVSRDDFAAEREHHRELLEIQKLEYEGKLADERERRCEAVMDLTGVTRALEGKDAVGDSKEALWVQRVVRERHALRAEVEQLRRDLAAMGMSDGRVPLSTIERECRNACICGGGHERGSGCPACEVWHEVRLSTEQATNQ